MKLKLNFLLLFITMHSIGDTYHEKKKYNTFGYPVIIILVISMGVNLAVGIRENYLFLKKKYIKFRKKKRVSVKGVNKSIINRNKFSMKKLRRKTQKNRVFSNIITKNEGGISKNEGFQVRIIKQTRANRKRKETFLNLIRAGRVKKNKKRK